MVNIRGIEDSQRCGQGIQVEKLEIPTSKSFQSSDVSQVLVV